VDNYILDTNTLVMFSPHGDDPRRLWKLNEFIIKGLLDGDKRFYMTSFTFFEMMRDESPLFQNNKKEFADALDFNLFRKVEILPTAFEKELYYIILQYKEQLISYECCMEEMLRETKNKLSIMLYNFIFTYLLFHLTIMQLLEMKSNMTESMEERLKEKYGDYCATINADDFNKELIEECEKLVNNNYPNGSSKNEINKIILNRLNEFDFNINFKKIINIKTIEMFNKKYPEAIYNFNLISYYLYDLHKFLPIKNFETISSYLIEKLTMNNHLIELNDFIDLYNVSFISDDFTLITLDQKWVKFLNENNQKIKILQKSSDICNELIS